MKNKLCKKCNIEITHNRKRRLCLDCLKEEQREYYQFGKVKYCNARKLKRLSIKKGD